MSSSSMGDHFEQLQLTAFLDGATLLIACSTWNMQSSRLEVCHIDYNAFHSVEESGRVISYDDFWLT